MRKVIEGRDVRHRIKMYKGEKETDEEVSSIRNCCRQADGYV